MRLSELSVKRNKISRIFISHLHGDHVYGLPGLLSSYNHFSRTTPITVTGPKGIRDLLEQIFHWSQVHLLFPLEIVEIPQGASSFEALHTDGLVVTAFPLLHRIPTWGYRFDYEAPLYNINPEAMREYRLTIDEIKSAKNGTAPIRNAQPVPLEKVVLPKEKKASYAYCSDTVATPTVLPYISGADMLYHEATYRSDLSEKAVETRHSTAEDAARIAVEAGVDRLIIGHYSSRYRFLDGHLREARAIFPESYLAVEGEEWMIPKMQ